VIGRSDSTKSFSPNQWSTAGLAANGTQTTTTTLNGTVVTNPQSGMAYPSTGADYNRVFNALVAYFPALEVNRGLPLGFRWRSLPAGNRELRTISDTSRYLIALEGPLPLPFSFFSEWEYRSGLAQSKSKSKSRLLNGYYYTLPFANLIKSGVLSPFSYTQSQAAMDGLKAASASGVELYGGTFTTTTADFTTSGPLFKLPAGTVYTALGFDYRKEEYYFAGDPRPNVSTADSLIFNAPFDNGLATAGTLSRDIYAFFAELQIPLLKNLDLNLAARRDDYTGFGSTTNPKYTLRYAPIEQLLFRGSYSTGFRVPTFKQQFDPSFETIYAGVDLRRPAHRHGDPGEQSQHDQRRQSRPKARRGQDEVRGHRDFAGEEHHLRRRLVVREPHRHDPVAGHVRHSAELPALPRPHHPRRRHLHAHHQDRHSSAQRRRNDHQGSRV